MEDASGLNALLEQFKKAEGVPVFVSNGYMVFPYEDGQPDNTAFKIITIQEQKIKLERTLSTVKSSLVEHQNAVADAEEKLATANADYAACKNEINPVAKDLTYFKDRIDAVTEILNQFKNQVLMDDAEIKRTIVNMASCDAAIAELQTPPALVTAQPEVTSAPVAEDIVAPAADTPVEAVPVEAPVEPVPAATDAVPQGEQVL